MKTIKLIIILIIFGFNSTCNAQDSNNEKNPLFLIMLPSGKEILCNPADLIIRPSEILSIEEVTQKDFLKTHPKKVVLCVFKLTPKAYINFLNIDEIMEKYKIPKKAKNYTITILGNKTYDRKNIYASSESISEVKIDKVNQMINILCKP